MQLLKQNETQDSHCCCKNQLPVVCHTLICRDRICQLKKEIAKKFSSKDIVNKINSVETNIIIIELNKSVNKQQIINHFTNHNVIFDWYSMGVQKIRIVTHLDYTEKDHEDLIEIVDKL